MPRVIIRNDGTSLDVPEGARLIKYASSLMVGCRDGECGMCVCSVVRGSENINPRTAKEEQTLARMRAYPSQRLACQIYVKKGEVEIEY